LDPDSLEMLDQESGSSSEEFHPKSTEKNPTIKFLPLQMVARKKNGTEIGVTDPYYFDKDSDPDPGEVKLMFLLKDTLFTHPDRST
jgi:hypothetical protein